MVISIHFFPSVPSSTIQNKSHLPYFTSSPKRSSSCQTIYLLLVDKVASSIGKKRYQLISQGSPMLYLLPRPIRKVSSLSPVISPDQDEISPVFLTGILQGGLGPLSPPLVLRQLALLSRMNNDMNILLENKIDLLPK